MEYRFGEEIRKDAEKEFRILQFQSISFIPLWLNLMRKRDNTVDFDSHTSFESSIKGDKSQSFKYGYVHNIGPATLQLWGVKYVLARIDSETRFDEYVLKSGRYDLKKIDKYETLFGNKRREIGFFYNNDYLGQVFFARFEGKEERDEKQPFWRRVLRKSKGKSPEGILYDKKSLENLKTNTLSVYIRLKATSPSHISIKGAGNSESWTTAAGRQIVWMPYKIFDHGEEIKYQISSVEKKGKIRVEKIDVLPMYLSDKSVIEGSVITRKRAHAKILTDFRGCLIFSLPYDRFWEAKVDGRSSPVIKGPAGTLAVEISAGKHLVEVNYN
jgi:hypothetical protein